ncbi:MAG: class I SAM-dependent methyltransferase [Lachnospiraceae bacterium]|nr:class I SAM-dependent methyltransferase [Lachnospiraceae bacterium]
MYEERYLSKQAEAAQAALWDEKAKPCTHYKRRSPYAEEFLLRSGIVPGDTVLDMGCGSGTLCLPLADDGHRVFCGDISEKMLASVRNVIEAEGITSITLKKMSFYDDWTDVPVCDMVFASRSLIDVDPMIVLPKLSAHAKKRVCITLHVDLNDGEISGFRYKGADTISYFRSCINAVIDMGYLPRVEYMSCMFDGKKGWAFIAWDV